LLPPSCVAITDLDLYDVARKEYLDRRRLGETERFD
jgi:hypothetical protein